MRQKIFLCIIPFIFIVSCRNDSKPSNKNSKLSIDHTEKGTEPKEVTEISKNIKLSKLKDLIIGTWKRNDNSLYTLVFSKNNNNNNNEVEGVFYDGGPFEEYLNCVFINEKKMDLYFNFIAGSNSFNKFNNPSDEDDCKTKVISCSLMSENKLLIDTYKDKCGQIIEEKNITLIKN